METDSGNTGRPKVLNVGHCSFDHGNIERVLVDHLEAEVDKAATSDEALRAVEEDAYDLVLVNRVFDANGESGLDLIRKMRSQPRTQATPVMLVSNFPEAQQAAVAIGARPGFGKAALQSPEARGRLLTLLSEELARKRPQ